MKLHIGGKQIKDDWKILNIQKNAGVDFVGDINDLSQFSTDSIDEIYASHVLEHISHTKIMATLQGIFRVLKKRRKILCLRTRYGCSLSYVYKSVSIT